MDSARQIVSFERFTKALAIDSKEIPQYSADLQAFEERLRCVSERARKLLVQIAELAEHGRGEQRKADVAYLPELYECTGLGVEEMYPLVEELKTARFIAIEDRYPFEDVKILLASTGWNILAALARFAQSEKISLRDVVVEMRFELLE